MMTLRFFRSRFPADDANIFFDGFNFFLGFTVVVGSACHAKSPRGQSSSLENPISLLIFDGSSLDFPETIVARTLELVCFFFRD